MFKVWQGNQAYLEVDKGDASEDVDKGSRIAWGHVMRVNDSLQMVRESYPLFLAWLRWEQVHYILA